MNNLKILNIENNDAYVLAQSKNFMIINSNYHGITLLNSDLSFIKEIDISNELLIYNIYSSLKNDKLVIFDGENRMLFLLDLNDLKNIVQIERKQIFLNWFITEKNFFKLRDRNYEYCLSFKNGKELWHRPCIKQNILSYEDDGFLFEKDGELNLFFDGIEQRLNRRYDESKSYSLSRNYIIEYDEKTLNVIGDTTMTDTISVQSSWLIRKVLVKGEILTILLSDINSSINSKLIKYEMYSKIPLNDVIDNWDRS